jgi:anti-anti-sigma regulatory factor
MTQQTAHLRLTGALRLATAERLAKQLHKGLAERDVAIDATEVSDLDAATLQVLVSAKATAATQGRHLSLTFSPDSRAEAMIQRLCLSDALGLGLAAQSLQLPATSSLTKDH